MTYSKKVAIQFNENMIKYSFLLDFNLNQTSFLLLPIFKLFSNFAVYSPRLLTVYTIKNIPINSLLLYLNIVSILSSLSCVRALSILNHNNEPTKRK